MMHISQEFQLFVMFLFSMSLLMFLAVWKKDPGYLKKDNSIDFFSIIDKFDVNQLCPECEVIRTDRSRHCNVCK